jgi:pyruvate formate lyase activating enzyme
VFDIQRFSVHDGPGIRTLVFLKGCPLKCLWCSNPEGQKREPELTYRPSLCIRCGECVTACTRKALELAPAKVAVDPSRCRPCGECVNACRTGALSLAGDELIVDDILSAVERDRVFYGPSGETSGGVTLSGGEPLDQPDFAEALLKGAKAMGLHTAVETCGHVPWPALERILKWTDVALYDLKHMDADVHADLTGVSNQLILENAAKAASTVRMVVRMPVVPGLTDNTENVDALCEFVAGLAGVKEVHLLPYHRLGLSKYSMLSRTCPLPNLKAPSRNTMDRLAARASLHGLSVKVVS